MQVKLSASATRILVRSVILALIGYLFVAFVTWEPNPGAWSVDARGPAASIYAFSVFILWIVELD